MIESSLEEARRILEAYATTEPHHLFKLKPHVDSSQRIYEGYILDVEEQVLIFCWAPSPFDEPGDERDKEYEIPILDIDLSSLHTHTEWAEIRHKAKVEQTLRAHQAREAERADSFRLTSIPSPLRYIAAVFICGVLIWICIHVIIYNLSDR